MPFSADLYPTHLGPDADLILIQLLKERTDASVSTQYPARLVMPHLLAVTTPAGAAPEPRYQTRAGIQLDAMAGSRDLAGLILRQAIAVLEHAWFTQRVVDAGWIRTLSLASGPAETRDNAQPDGLWQFTATFTAIFRAA